MRNDAFRMPVGVKNAVKPYILCKKQGDETFIRQPKLTQAGLALGICRLVRHQHERVAGHCEIAGRSGDAW